MTIKCSECGQIVPRDAAHEVKANNVCGRDWRCDRCGDAAGAEIRAHNLEIRARMLRRQADTKET